MNGTTCNSHKTQLLPMSIGSFFSFCVFMTGEAVAGGSVIYMGKSEDEGRGSDIIGPIGMG